MILVHTVENGHKDSLIRLIEEFKLNHDTRVPEHAMGKNNNTNLV